MINYMPILNESVDADTLKKCYFILGSSNYYKNIPIYYYGSIPLITLKMTINLEEKTFSYTVFNNNTNGIYVPYYNEPLHKNEVLQKVEFEIYTIFDKLKRTGVLL